MPAAAKLSLLFVAYAAVAPSTTYRAAVVEFLPQPVSGNETSAEALAIRLRNLARVEEYMVKAKANGTQIIVFPEYGMIGDAEWTRDNILPFMEQIPDPHASPARLNPCEEKGALEATAPLTVGGSCLAKKYGMALVLALGDTHTCIPGADAGASKPCPKDGRVQFNTAIAFGEDGALLERYHKQHSYFEGYYDFAPSSHRGRPQGRFRTQFGVDFGMFICFDILW